MKYKNVAVDQLERVSDGKLYAVNILLKSGETVHLEGLDKGQKDAYVLFAKHGGLPMLLESKQTLWRIQAEDVQRLDIKSYSEEQDGFLYPVLRFIMGQSRVNTSLYIKGLQVFIFWSVAAAILSIAKAVMDGNVLEIFLERDVMADILVSTVNMIQTGLKFIVIYVVLLAGIDMALKPLERFYIIDEERPIIAGTKLSHLLLTIALVLGTNVFIMVLNLVATRLIA